MRRNLFAALVLLSCSSSVVHASQFVVYADGKQELPGVDVATVNAIGSAAYQVRFNADVDVQPWLQRWQVAGTRFEQEEPVVFVGDRAEPYAHVDSDTNQQSLKTWNDPLQSSQTEWDWSLNGVRKGLSEQRASLSPVNVAVLDVGYLSHEDLLPVSGYSFTTYSNATLSDNYTATSSNGGQTCSSAHGNNMMGIIGATRDNGKGIVGISSASLYVGRVLATDCVTGNDVGLLSDVANGIYWSIGTSSSHKIPKADFINISVAAESHCPAILQNAINAANDAGSIVVVSAGNYSSLADKYAPANCQGVVVVSAHNESGERASYANYGDRLSMTVGGSRFTVGASGYERVNGTSGAAATVTGMLASLKQSFPAVSNKKILEVFKSSLVKNKQSCQFDCGAGYANLSTAFLRSEKLFEPAFSMKHAFGNGGDCKQERQIDGLNGYINACQSYELYVQSLHAKDSVRAVAHEVKVVRRSVNESDWVPGRFETMSKITPIANKQLFPVLDVDPVMYEYGVVACDGDYCPYPVDINVAGIAKPLGCR